LGETSQVNKLYFSWKWTY